MQRVNSLQCWWLALDIYLAALRLGKHPYLLHGRDFFDKNPMENQLDFIHFIHFLEMHPPPPGISNPSVWGIWIFSSSVFEKLSKIVLLLLDFVSDINSTYCLRRTMALQEAMFAMQITSDLLSHARLAREKER